jgi:hypothetical protein
MVEQLLQLRIAAHSRLPVLKKNMSGKYAW